MLPSYTCVRIIVIIVIDRSPLIAFSHQSSFLQVCRHDRIKSRLFVKSDSEPLCGVWKTTEETPWQVRISQPRLPLTKEHEFRYIVFPFHGMIQSFTPRPLIRLSGSVDMRSVFIQLSSSIVFYSPALSIHPKLILCTMICKITKVIKNDIVPLICQQHADGSNPLI